MDLPWRLIHGLLAVNAFISILDSAASSTCLSEAVETVSLLHKMFLTGYSLYNIGLFILNRRDFLPENIHLWF